MIRYALRCAEGHTFESWFRDSQAFDALKSADQITCSACGSTDVSKTIMAPAVSASRKKTPAPMNDGEAEAKAGDSADAAVPAQPTGPLSEPSTPLEAAMKTLRQHLRENSDYVGKTFASEARSMHEGTSDKRSIWGEASREEAEALKEDGIPVAPLPPFVRHDD